MDRAWVVSLLLVLVVTPAGAEWTQLRAEGERTGAAGLAATPWDVIGQGQLPAPEYPWAFTTSPGLVAVGEAHMGVLWSVADRVSCILVTVEIPAASRWNVEQQTLEHCRNGHLIGYHAPDNLLILCSEGPAEAPILQARNASTGQLVWSASPGSFPGIHTAESWTCRGGALDEDGPSVVVAYAGWSNGRPTEAVAARHLVTTGGPRDIVALPAKQFMANQLGLAAAEPGLVEDTFPAEVVGTFHPLAVTLVQGGFVVTGHYCNSTCTDPETPDSNPVVEGALVAAAAWVGPDGTLAGTALAQPLEPAGVRSAAGSRWSASAFGESHLLMGANVLTIDPASAEPIRQSPSPMRENTAGQVTLAAPLAVDNLLILPGYRRVAAMDLNGDAAWTRPWGLDQQGVAVEDILVTAAGRLWVLASYPAGDTRALMASQLDAQTGREIQRLPLHAYGGIQANPTRMAKWVPLNETALLAVDDVGSVSFVAATLQPQHLQVSQRYPQPGDEVHATVPGMANATRLLVNWGDGSLQEFAPASRIGHRYEDAGARQIVLTRVLADGTTQTHTTLVDVGGTPPPRLSFIQEAFAPENQDMTWGVIGIAIALGGTALAVVRNQRRRSTLGRHLRALEAIRAGNQDSPLAGMDDLDAYERTMEQHLSSGRLDDAQFHALELRATRLQRAFRRSFLAPFHGRLDPRFERLVEAALEDGVVSDSEHALLLDAIAQQKDLGDEDRQKLARLVDARHRPATKQPTARS